jgi:hypothetical protein
MKKAYFSPSETSRNLYLVRGLLRVDKDYDMTGISFHKLAG